MNHLTLLALDTSTEDCSVALLHRGEITESHELAQRSHTKRILPMVEEILAQSGINLKQVDGLVFGRGPGSFTGVRVGAGIAQGLAFGAALPVIPISNLTAMAQAAYEQYGSLQVLAAIDARMNEVYFSQLQAVFVQEQGREYIQWQEKITEQVASPEAVLAQLMEQEQLLQNHWSCVGTGWRAYEQFDRLWQEKIQKTDIELPSARYMLPLALEKWHKKEMISSTEIEPIYLRNEVTWQKLPSRE